MLKLTNLEYNEKGNIDMRFKHMAFDIRLYSEPDNNIEEALRQYGHFLGAKSHHPQYKTKGFDERCIKTTDLGINNGCAWFLRYKDTKPETINEILSGTLYLLKIHVLFIKYNIEFCSLCNSDVNNFDFDGTTTRATNRSTKTKLLSEVNQLLAEGFKKAKQRETYIFNPKLTKRNYGSNTVTF